MPYEQFLQKRLFEPLGMKDTKFLLTADDLKRLAKSYKPGANNTGLEETNIGQLSYPLDGPNRYPCPAGGLFSTAADVAAFGQLILSGGESHGKRLVSAASVRQMTSKQTTLAGYGFGFSSHTEAPADGSGTVPVGECGARRRVCNGCHDRSGARTGHRLDGAACRVSGKRQRRARGVPRRGKQGIRRRSEEIG